MVLYDLLFLTDTTLASLALPEYATMATIANVSAVLMGIGVVFWSLPLLAISLFGGGAGLFIGVIMSIHLVITWLVWSAVVSIATTLYPSIGAVASVVLIIIGMTLWGVLSRLCRTQ